MDFQFLGLLLAEDWRRLWIRRGVYILAARSPITPPSKQPVIKFPPPPLSLLSHHHDYNHNHHHHNSHNHLHCAHSILPPYYIIYICYRPSVKTSDLQHNYPSRSHLVDLLETACGCVSTYFKSSLYRVPNCSTMATAAIYTPVKSHTGIFSTRTAGGRIPLTPSPRSRAANNTTSPFTPSPPSPSLPPRTRHNDPDWHVEKTKKYTSLSESLSAAFTSLKVSAKPRESITTHSPKVTSSPKSDITKKTFLPARLEQTVSEWTLNSSAAPVKKKIRREVGKKTLRMNGDRFIPNRSASSPTAATKAQRIVTSRPRSSRLVSTNLILEGSVFSHDDNISAVSLANDDDDFRYAPNADLLTFQSSIADACGLNLSTRILEFKPKAPESLKPIDTRAQYNRPLRPVRSTRRRIATAPERVLDAPGLLDDYYLNLLDWSSRNMVVIGLETQVYIWNGNTGSSSSLMETAMNTYISSVKWSADGGFVAIGTGNGDVEVWDIEDQTKVRTMRGHESRVGVMSWSQAILSTGAQSGNIFNHDVRIADHKIAELNGHTSELCGLEWRADGAQLASGGNDNLVNIWDARLLAAPRWTKTNHNAAVKALVWCPWQSNLLATGGGNHDGCIHFWNSTTGARVNSIDTGSQVTSLKWSTK